MRLTAYSIADVGGVWRVWDGVRSWQAKGSVLVVTSRDGALETVHLPREVIGLADDSAKTPYHSTATHYQDRREPKQVEPLPLTVPRAPSVKHYQP